MTDIHEAVIEAAINTGFDPTDECEGPFEWIAQRWDGYQRLPACCGWLGFTHRDGEVTLFHTTHSGVLCTEARFTLSDEGLAMFEAAVKAIQSRVKGVNPMPITLQLNQHQAERLTDILDQSFATSVNHLVSSVEAQVANPEGEWAKSAPRIADHVETDRKLKLLLSRAVNGDDS